MNKIWKTILPVVEDRLISSPLPPQFFSSLSPLCHSNKQRNIRGTAQYQVAPHPDEVDCKVHETLAFQEWITEETREMHNFHTNVLFVKIFVNIS